MKLLIVHGRYSVAPAREQEIAEEFMRRFSPSHEEAYIFGIKQSAEPQDKRAGREIGSQINDYKQEIVIDLHHSFIALKARDSVYDIILGLERAVDHVGYETGLPKGLKEVKKSLFTLRNKIG